MLLAWLADISVPGCWTMRALEASAVVANCAMNRERQLAGANSDRRWTYTRDESLAQARHSSAPDRDEQPPARAPSGHRPPPCEWRRWPPSTLDGSPRQFRLHLPRCHDEPGVSA
jgi:hypothetical protein